jgi:DNA polymerase-3 subunit epsilon
MQKYDWFDSAPVNLKTKTALRELRLKPASEPKGYIYWERKKKTYYLYDITETTPIKEQTEKQKAALERNRAKQYTCPQCNQVGNTKLNGNICLTCVIQNDHESAVQWAKELVNKPDSFVILDTETTELEQPEIIQIAVINGNGETLFDSLVKPVGSISASATSIHGITAETVASVPKWNELFPRLQEACHGKKVITYNLRFDSKALLVTDRVNRGVRKGLGSSAECAMLEYASYVGELKASEEIQYYWQKLPYADHSALGDCLGTLRLIREMADDTAPRMIG